MRTVRLICPARFSTSPLAHQRGGRAQGHTTGVASNEVLFYDIMPTSMASILLPIRLLLLLLHFDFSPVVSQTTSVHFMPGMGPYRIIHEEGVTFHHLLLGFIRFHPGVSIMPRRLSSLTQRTKIVETTRTPRVMYVMAHPVKTPPVFDLIS